MATRGSEPSCSRTSLGNGLGHGNASADEERVRGLVVLGLREEVGGDELRIGLVVRDDEDFARAGDAVDGDARRRRGAWRRRRRALPGPTILSTRGTDAVP